jgi:RNA polymerase sigma-70 factor (ECF subfamily)
LTVAAPIYRIATNVAANHVNQERRRNAPLISLDVADDLPASDTSDATDQDLALRKLFGIIERLGNPDRSVITLYLEGLDAASIGEITGMTPGAIATRISRIKTLLARLFREARND